ncbi:MAG: hypothetical protein IIY06_08485 [Proteobacteria bacterium]|jgi:hypothetical protein|nr:hypothetical protein [Pseudomonadota bacterium]
MKHLLSPLVILTLCLWSCLLWAQEEEKVGEPSVVTTLSEPEGLLSAAALVDYTEMIAEAVSKQPTCEATRRAINMIPEGIRQEAARILMFPEQYDLKKETYAVIRGYVRTAAASKSKCPAIVEAYRELAVAAARLDVSAPSAKP